MVPWIQKAKKKPRKKKFLLARPVDGVYVREVKPVGSRVKTKTNRLKMAKRLHSRGWNAVSAHKFDSHRSIAAQGGH